MALEDDGNVYEARRVVNCETFITSGHRLMSFEKWVKAKEGIAALIECMGYDPDSSGLKDTPARVVKAMAEMVCGWSGSKEREEVELKHLFTVFDQPYDEMVLIRDIEFTSLCEHHLLPFSGVAHVGYLPAEGKVVGLSKIPRLVDLFSKRLQLQERLTTQITDTLDQYLTPKGAACVVEAKHGCISCRGVRKAGALTITSSMTGAFKTDPATRSEFLNLIRG